MSKLRLPIYMKTEGARFGALLEWLYLLTDMTWKLYSPKGRSEFLLEGEHVVFVLKN